MVVEQPVAVTDVPRQMDLTRALEGQLSGNAVTTVATPGVYDALSGQNNGSSGPPRRKP